MAYKLQTQKLIPGGLNLIAPGDQISEGDCLNLRDWWAGSAGRLEQSPTSVVRNSPSVISEQDSICQVDGRIYYGGGGSLRQIGRSADAAIDTGYDSYPLGMISYQGYAWVMNRSKQRKDDGTTVTDWTPAAPGAPTLTDGGVDGAALSPAVGNPPEVGGLFALEYKYYITWAGPLGESNPSPVATITPAVDGSIVRIAYSSAPSWATGWNVYRRSPTLDTPYRLNETTLDIARAYVDDYGDDVHTHSDDQLVRLGIIMEGDHDAAPAARVIANQVYNGRIVVANSAANPNRIWYTPALQPAFFRGSGNPNDGDWVDVGTDKGDEILFMAVRPGMTIIYRSRSIWRQVGDFGTGTLEVLVPDMGVVGPRAVASTSLGDYFIGQEGVYRLNNDWAQKLSTKVDPVFRGLATENLITLGTSYRSKCAIGQRNGRLWVSYPNSGGTLAATLIYHIESERWFNRGLAFGAYMDTGTELLGAGGGIYAAEDSYVSGATILDYQSEYQDCSLPDHEKTWADLVLNHNTQGVDLTVKAKLNKGGTTVTLATINSSSLTKQVIPLVDGAGDPLRCFNLAIEITGNGGSGAAVIIDSPMLLHYYLEARKARSFDSDETDHGAEQVKTVDQVEIDIEGATGTAVLQVYSDFPGGQVVAREGSGVTVPATVGRQSQKLVLPTPADGRLLRYTVKGPDEFQIYGMRARLLPIGVYLDGTIGDFWQPSPQSIGV